MHGLRRAVVCAVFALGAGCYSASFPLDREPQAELDPALLATWSCLAVDGGDDNSAALMRVERAGERVYRAAFEAPGEEPERYELRVSLIGSEPIAGGKPWTLARYRLTRPHLLEVRLASEEGLKDVAATPAAVRAALLERLDRPGVFEDTLVCVRRKPQPAHAEP
jgi:hypothetical protein